VERIVSPPSVAKPLVMTALRRADADILFYWRAVFIVAARYAETYRLLFLSVTPSTKSTKFDRLIDGASLYISIKIGELWPRGPPMKGVKKIVTLSSYIVWPSATKFVTIRGICAGSRSSPILVNLGRGPAIPCGHTHHFTARFDGVLEFGYNSAESELIWMKSGAL